MYIYIYIYIHVLSDVLWVKCLEFKVHMCVVYFDCCEKNQVGIAVFIGVFQACSWRWYVRGGYVDVQRTHSLIICIKHNGDDASK